jgi:hypothetical protein
MLIFDYKSGFEINIFEHINENFDCETLHFRPESHMIISFKTETWRSESVGRNNEFK